MKLIRKHTTTETQRLFGRAPARIAATLTFLGLLSACLFVPARAQEHPAPAGTAAAPGTSPATTSAPSAAGNASPGSGTVTEGVRTPGPAGMGETNSPTRTSEPAGKAEAGGEKKKEEPEIGIHLPTWISGILEDFWYHGPSSVSAAGVIGATADELKDKKVEWEWENHHFHGEPKPTYHLSSKVGEIGKQTALLPGQHTEKAKVDGREIELINPEATFQYAGSLPEGLAVSLLTALTICIVGALMCRNLQRVPNRKQMFLEIIYGYFDNFCRELIGPHYKRYVPIVGSIYVYILIMNLAGLIPGWMSPTANINVTAGLALVVIVYVQIEGLRVNGLKGYLLHFVGEPWWLFALNFPLHVIGEVARVLSLSVRLFGNIFGEDVVIVILIGLCVKFTGGWIPGQAPMYLLAIFTSFVQAMVFSILTCVYISLMTTHEDHGGAEHGGGHGHDDHGHVHDAAAPVHAH